MKSILYGVLIGAAVTLAAQSFISKSYADPDPPKSGACDDSKRYPEKPDPGGGTQIQDNQHDAMIAAWNQQTIRINSAYISKIAIDSIFSRDMTANCLKIESAIGEDDKPTILFSGVSRNFVLVNFLDSQSVTYISTDNTCPHNCD